MAAVNHLCPSHCAASTCLWFPTMDAGCQHCEEILLEVAVAHGLCPPPSQRMGLAQVGGCRRCCRQAVSHRSSRLAGLPVGPKLRQPRQRAGSERHKPSRPLVQLRILALHVVSRPSGSLPLPTPVLRCCEPILSCRVSSWAARRRQTSLLRRPRCSASHAARSYGGAHRGGRLQPQGRMLCVQRMLLCQQALPARAGTAGASMFGTLPSGVVQAGRRALFGGRRL